MVLARRERTVEQVLQYCDHPTDNRHTDDWESLEERDPQCRYGPGRSVYRNVDTVCRQKQTSREGGRLRRGWSSDQFASLVKEENSQVPTLGVCKTEKGGLRHALLCSFPRILSSLQGCKLRCFRFVFYDLNARKTCRRLISISLKDGQAWMRQAAVEVKR